MESQGLLDDSLISGSQPTRAAGVWAGGGADVSFCPDSQNTPRPRAAPLVPASDESDTDFEEEAEDAAPLPRPRRLKDCLVDADGPAVVDDTLDVEEERYDTAPLEAGPRSQSPVHETFVDESRVDDVDLEADTQLVDSGNGAGTWRDQSADTAPGLVPRTSSGSVDLEAETQLYVSAAGGEATRDQSAGTAPGLLPRTSSSSVDLEAETQLYVSTVGGQAARDQSAGTAGGLAPPTSSSSVDLEAETQLYVSTNSSKGVSLEAAAQPHEPTPRSSSRNAHLEAEAGLYISPIKAPSKARTADLDAETELYISPVKFASTSPTIGVNAAAHPPVSAAAEPDPGRSPVVGQGRCTPRAPERHSTAGSRPPDEDCGVDLDAATQVCQPRCDNRADLSAVDLDAATQVYQPKCDNRADLSAVDLDAATQVYQPKRGDRADLSAVDLDAATQVYQPKCDNRADLSAVDLDAATQVYQPKRGDRADLSAVDLDAATQVCQPRRDNRADLSAVDLDAATQVYQPRCDNRADACDVDLDAATQVYEPEVVDRERACDVDLGGTSRDRERSGGRRTETCGVDLDAATQVYQPEDGRSVEACDGDLDAAAQIYRHEGCSRSTACDVDLEAATEEYRPDVQTGPGLDSAAAPEDCLSTPGVISVKSAASAGEVGDAEDMVATQRMASPPAATGVHNTSGSELFLSPSRHASRESETQETRLLPPNSRDVLQVLRMTASPRPSPLSERPESELDSKGCAAPAAGDGGGGRRRSAIVRSHLQPWPRPRGRPAHDAGSGGGGTRRSAIVRSHLQPWPRPRGRPAPDADSGGGGRRRSAIVRSHLQPWPRPRGRSAPDADSGGGGRRRSAIVRSHLQPWPRPRGFARTARTSRRRAADDDTESDSRHEDSSVVTVSSQVSLRSVGGSRRGASARGRPRVLFTGFSSPQNERAVTALGGEMVKRPAECTVLVTTEVKRTIKFMACFARGIPIVSPAWLTKSKQAKFFLDPWEFLVRDGPAEKKFGFHLDLNLRKASRSAHPLLRGWSFYVTPHVVPPPDQLREIVECAGGVFLAGPPRSAADRLLVVSCVADTASWTAARRLHLPVVSAELLPQRHPPAAGGRRRAPPVGLSRARPTATVEGSRPSVAPSAIVPG
ncbi:mediator of DNA damage checkpoint protein 1-like [Pollicipes pollicipes]|uniref:mediator of DNA damage checkpoint protein 1-like n=1 Tax=Pollicipes pollicipes TaxID=41117 RepID=UPI0018854291|nr:mediator of DNA damage checkpoint protein 1-like [Pollicipes pollicipes]